MNTTNVTRVQLPDGRLVTIEGGDAASTAEFLARHYLGQPGASPPPVGNSTFVTSNQPVKPLVMPTMNFSKPSSEAPQEEPVPDYSGMAPAHNRGSGQVAPLVLPVMNFRSKEDKARAYRRR